MKPHKQILISLADQLERNLHWPVDVLFNDLYIDFYSKELYQLGNRLTDRLKK
jgi:hypothetical protein